MKRVTLRRLLAAGLLALCIGVLLGGTRVAAELAPKPYADGGTISENEYWDLVEKTRQEVARLKGKAPEEMRRGVDDLIMEWQAIRGVTPADSHRVPIDNSYLLAALSAEKPDLYRIQSMLISLEAAHKTYPSKVFSAADLDFLREILARPEFRALNQTSNPLQEWLQDRWRQLIKWFADLLQRLFGNINLDARIGDWPPLGVISAVVLALVLMYAVRSIFIDLASEAKVNQDLADPDKALTSDTAFERAQTLSRGGDYRSAVRYLYLSCLLLLDERGLLRYDHSKTNREVLRSVSGAPELAHPLREVIAVFDNVWYGYHTLDEDSFRRYSQRVEELKGQEK